MSAFETISDGVIISAGSPSDSEGGGIECDRIGCLRLPCGEVLVAPHRSKKAVLR